MSYKIILADPPWQYNDKSMNRGGAERHYPTMSLEEMRRLRVLGLADQECALCMWITFPQLETAKELIKLWGFEYVTCLFVWVKTYKDGDPGNTFVGMGHYTRSNAELMILARPKRKKTPKRINASIRQVQFFPVTKHSAKPPEFRDLIVDLFGDLPRIELFARDSAPGWDHWGNELDTNIKLGPSPFKNLGEAYRFALAEREPSDRDYRMICPKCYDLDEVKALECDDGGGLLFECGRCGYQKTAPELVHFKTALQPYHREACRA